MVLVTAVALEVVVQEILLVVQVLQVLVEEMVVRQELLELR